MRMQRSSIDAVKSPRPGVARRADSKTTRVPRVKTEDGLECQECDWVGIEEEKNRHELPGDSWHECPECGAECSHWPIDELGDPLPARRG